MRRLMLSTVPFLLLVGCTHVFSERTEKLVDPTISFEQVSKEPQAFVGKYIKVGGVIANTKITKSGTQIEVVQLRLNDDGMPEETNGTAGRFLATSTGFLDNMIFKSGRPVALIGEITGVKTLPLGEIEYTYPVIAITEIHLWKTEDLYPYPPYYYDPYPYRWYGPPHRYPFGPRYYW